MKQMYLLFIAVFPLAAASTLFFESHKTSLHEGRNQPCPPETDAGCPLGATCCHLVTGFAVCCQGENAVCCPNSLHCCPAGHKCDEGTGLCTSGDPHLTAMWTDMFFPPKPSEEKFSSKAEEPAPKREPPSREGKMISCPDQKEQCPDNSTCCAAKAGGYGCCPTINAVCCADKVYCCPPGYMCEGGGGCELNDTRAATLGLVHFNKAPGQKIMKTKTPTQVPDASPILKESSISPDSVVASDVRCPDGQTACPSGNTCCKLASGQYGCCPVPKAVCCKDGVHCCPDGYTCDVRAGTCHSQNSVISWFTKTSAKTFKEKVGSVMCPDGQSECPNGNTCCRLAIGQYGCCPVPDAVCCKDGVHCCPNGHTCDVSAGTCHLQNSVMSWLTKTPAKMPSENVGIVMCPDGQSQCPDGNTCCKLPSGQYGCCPVPDAVCCKDGVHCCPNGFTCQTTTGVCVQETKAISVIPDKAVLVDTNVGIVICPDGQSQCPNGNTCCKLPSGQYGCCPVPDAVCCKDGVHCCPNGFTCQTTTGECVQETKAISVIPDKAVLVDTNVGIVMCPDGQSQCPDGNTCCKLPSGQYGCCPVPDAVCCKDGVHCCPNGFTCQTTTGECVQETKAISVIPDKAVLVDTNVGIVICPDGQSQCPDGNTCCKLPSGQYGCCPVPDAVCCKDGVHCCPNGFTCQTTTGECVQETKAISVIPDKAVLVDTNVGIVMCPDGQSQCPDGNTCCKLPSGQYGCCPVPDAVCCKDGVHCCPNGFTCQTTTGVCVQETKAISLIPDKAVLVDTNVGIVMCPDGQSQCPDGNTCCKLPSGQYGCCPVPDAVCCKDGVHCCPNGHTCDVSAGTCHLQNSVMSWLTKTPAKMPSENVGIVMCPDGQSQCPNGNTCCKLPSGQYGCCPVPDAVCCKDGVHCCPNGFTCQTTTGVCVQETKAISVIPDKAVLVDTNVGIVICPDGQSQCPDGNTCCKLPSGQYGCCPVPDAVCCKDGVHCCPNGFTCQTTTGVCVQETKAISLIPDKAVLVDTNVGIVMCPDGQSQCPNGNTCCKLPSGQYGCCPVPDAVCCKDGVHCCPNGHTCDVSAGTCHLQNSVMSWLTKTPAKMPSENVGIVMCPDGQSQCPNGNTCCKLPSGQYGCCPVPDAVCCKDGVHCCPNGFTCQTTTGECVQETKAISVIPDKAVLVDTNVGIVMCPDGQSQCPDGNTCCKLPSGQYGCCPVPDAVCCKDGVHCCPNGFTCQTTTGVCVQETKAISLIPDKAVLVDTNVGIVMCPDGQSQCPDGNTCCKLPSGQYGCCPVPDAVCCKDGVHCCPNGHTCDVSAGTCHLQNSVMSWLTKTPAKMPSENVGIVMCPDGQSQCPNGNTCCKLPSGQYGCCPVPDAVCCKDGVHCCPNGFTCQTTTGVCVQETKAISVIPDKAVLVDTNVGIVICPDGQSQCPDGNTCCKLPSGQYGCCPVPHALCCKDGVHCCIDGLHFLEGYECDVSKGSCKKSGQGQAEFMQKLSQRAAKGGHILL